MKLFDDAEDLDEVLGQLAGYASLCWTERVVHEGKYGRPDTREKVFDSDRALMAVKLAAIKIKELDVTHHATDPRYAKGKLDSDNEYIYVFYRANDVKPVAAYVGANGEYDAYYDFVNEYCGSPLLDIVGRTTWTEFHTELMPGLLNAGGWRDRINIVMADDTQINELTGLSIGMIQESAFWWLCTENFDALPDTTVQAMLKVYDKWE